MFTRFDRKWMSTWHDKLKRNNVGRATSHLFRFCPVLRCVVDDLLGSVKSWPKIENGNDFGSQFDSGRYIWEGSAGKARCQGE